MLSQKKRKDDKDENARNVAKPSGAVAFKGLPVFGDITNNSNQFTADNDQKINFVKSNGARVIETSSRVKLLQPRTDEASMDIERESIPPKVTSVATAPLLRVANDIDERDVDEPLAVTEYVDDLYSNLRKIELETKLSLVAMSDQPHINTRMYAILVDWLVEVHLRFKLVPDTLYLSIYIMNKYLEKAAIVRSEFQLVGVASLMIAAKYEEIYPPDPRDYVYMTDRAYTKDQLLQMETKVLGALQYFVTVPTPYCFLLRYLKAAHADRRIVQLSCFISESMLQEWDIISKYLPSVIASAAIFLARRELGRNAWSPTLLKYTSYREEDLYMCLEDMCKAMSHCSDLQTVVHKFSVKQFGKVAKMDIDWKL